MNASTTTATFDTVLYGRTSRDDKRRLTIENQQKTLRKWGATDAGVRTIVDELWDDGVSGKVPLFERKHGRKLREMLTAPRPVPLAVAVVYIDRFARDTLTGLQAARDLEQAGAKLVTTDDGYDTRGEHDPTYFQLRLVLAEAEHRRIRERTVKGIGRALEAGLAAPCGILSFGYRVTPSGLWEKDPIEAPIVALMYEMRANGQTVGEIYRWLCSLPQVLPGRRHQRRGAASVTMSSNHVGAEWSESTVSRILRRTCYKGERIVMGHVFPVPPIVSPELWDRVQTIMTAGGRLAREAKAKPPAGFLSGLITCGTCGSPVWAHRNVGGIVGGKRYTYDYYVCREAKQDWGRCKPKRVQVAVVDPMVWAELLAFLHDPGELLRKLIRADREHGGTIERLEQRATALRAVIAGADAEIANIWDLQAKHGWPLSHVERGIAAAHERRQAAAEELQATDAAQRRAGASQQDLASIAAALSELRQLADRAEEDIRLKAKIAAALIDTAVLRTIGEGRQKRGELTVRLRWGQALSGTLPERAASSPGGAKASAFATPGYESLPLVFAIPNRAPDWRTAARA
jgi:site-specific DNA recombinase